MTGQWTYGHGEGVMAHAGHWATASQYVQMAEHSLYISQNPITKNWKFAGTTLLMEREN